MSDKEWANESLRMALQNIQDAATKPLHVKIERLERELADCQAEHAAFSNNVEQCEAENDHLRCELAEARHVISGLRFELEGLERIRVRDNAYLIDQRDTARRELAEARELCAEISGLRRDLAEVEKTLAHYRAQYNEKADRLAEAERDNSALAGLLYVARYERDELCGSLGIQQGAAKMALDQRDALAARLAERERELAEAREALYSIASILASGLPAARQRYKIARVIEDMPCALAEARAEIAKLRATAEPLPARSCEHCGANLSAEGHEPDCVREGA